jgi:DNA-binding MarR family transcriptional regulator
MQKYDDPQISLCSQLGNTWDIITRAIELELKHLRLNIPQIRILSILAKQNEGATLSDIAFQSVRQLNSASTLLNKMVRSGLVKKIKKPGDDTRTFYVLTEKGQELYYEKMTERSIHMIFSCLSPEEHQNLEELLRKLREQSRDLLGIDYKPPFMS